MYIKVSSISLLWRMTTFVEVDGDGVLVVQDCGEVVLAGVVHHLGDGHAGEGHPASHHTAAQ